MRFLQSFSWGGATLFVLAATLPIPAFADDLYRPGFTRSLASDRRARLVGDLVTVLIVENAQSNTTQQNATNRSTDLGGSVNAGGFNQSASLSSGNAFSGSGGIQRTESFATQMTASITGVLPNGDFLIAGSERLHINGETTEVEVQGRIRPADIDGDDQVASNRIADARINYNGKGFVSRSAAPGIIHRIFAILGL